MDLCSPLRTLTPVSEQDGTDSILRRAMRGDRVAFSQLYRHHVQQVYRYIYARAGNAQDAEDITSQTFLAALENIKSYRPPAAFAGWLIGIARHKCVDHWRRNGARATVPIDEGTETAASGDRVAEWLDQRLELNQLQRVLQTLAPDRAEAVTLCLLAGLSAAEAGQVMDKSEAAIKKLIWRGVQDLKVRLGQETMR